MADTGRMSERPPSEQSWPAGQTLKATHVPYNGEKLPENVMILDDTDEFEAVLIDLVKHQREKRKQYGSDKDFLWNFYNIAERCHLTPLKVGELLKSKHETTLEKWWGTYGTSINPAHTPGSDDAYIDRAVYAILNLILYRRENAVDQSETQHGDGA